MPATSSIDELRIRYPTFGFALYALEPGGPVTLEIHASEVFTFEGPTEEAVIAAAFPEPAAPEPIDIFS